MDESVVRHLEQQNEVADVLRRAKALIGTPEKWSKKAASGPKYCAGLAISNGACAGDDTAWLRPVRLLAKATGVLATGIYAWNDAPERTHAEVMDAFSRAIELAVSADGDDDDHP